MDYKEIRLEKSGGIALLTLNSPQTMNALTASLLTEISDAFDEIEADDGLVAVIVTGTGKSFIAGGDISAMKNMSPEEAMRYSETVTTTFGKMASSKKIYIAAINGYALGGGSEFALACDLRIASENAKFGFPEVTLGVIPGGAGTQRLSRLVGTGKAKELILTAATIKADKALIIGLVNKMVQGEQLIDEAYAMAETLLKAGPVALGYAKECIDRSEEISLSAGIAYEREKFGKCFDTADRREGMSAFLEKREARFTGN